MNTIKCIKLLARAIVQVTINTYAEQGQAGADEVFKLLEQVESEIKAGECGENQKTTEAPKKTNFDKITESAESLAEFIEKYATNCLYCPLYKLEKCKVTGWKPESKLCKKELAEWLQQEADNV